MRKGICVRSCIQNLFKESLLSLTHLSFRASKFKFLVFGFVARPASLHLSEGDLGIHPCGEDANRSGKKNVPGATSSSLDSGSPRFLALRMKMVSNGREVETEDRPLASAMETDAPLHSNTKSFPNPRKRMNVPMEEQRGMDDIMVVTPPNATRTPARLRLSVSRKERPVYDSVYEDVQEVDIRNHLSRSSSRKDRQLYDPEINEDGSRKQLLRPSSRKDRPIYSVESREERTRRQLSGSSNRKDRSRYDAEVEEDDSRKVLLDYDADVQENGMEDLQLSERRRAMFEPLGPTLWGPRDGSPQSILPPPDFDFFSYPRGWVVGKRRKLVNVDVVESMRHIAVQEMNRKDREINGLNEQLEEDSRTMSHLQLQLQQERNKRIQAERENNMLQAQVSMLMTMLNEADEAGDEEM